MLESLIILFICLQIGDVWLTNKAIKSGKGQEANKIAAFFMNKFGVIWGLLIIKFIAGIILVTLLYFIYDKANTNLLVLCFVIINIVYAIVVYNNFKIAR
jgi:hypothetical protein